LTRRKGGGNNPAVHSLAEIRPGPGPACASSLERNTMQHLDTLFGSLENRRLDRRSFLQSLGIAAAAVAATPAEAAVPTRASWVSHYTYVAPDLKKTRDWYHEVFGMQIGHEEAKLSHLWYGDKGGNTLMIIRQAAPGEAAPRIERFAFTLDHWDAKAVESELKKQGLQPKSDTARGFWFNDPEGFEIGVFSKDYIKRPAVPDARPELWKALSVNHVVEYSSNYRKLGDWYKALLDLRETHDSKRDTYQWFGDSVWIPTQKPQDGKTSAELKSLDHVAYTIENYNNDAVKAELEKRKMNPRQDTDLSFNCVDVNGFKTQVCDKELVPVAEKRPPRGGQRR
jgi:catechol 2,3-dioxygenase-like lactoylglutathione lyase family enzyme